MRRRSPLLLCILCLWPNVRRHSLGAKRLILLLLLFLLVFSAISLADNTSEGFVGRVAAQGERDAAPAPALDGDVDGDATQLSTELRRKRSTTLPRRLTAELSSAFVATGVEPTATIWSPARRPAVCWPR